MVDKVDIGALQKVRFENFLEKDANDPTLIRVRPDLDPGELNAILKGTGLYYDAKTQMVARPGEKPRTLAAEAGMIHLIREGDTGGGADGAPDGFIDLKEADAILQRAALTDEDIKGIDPEGFLQSIQQLIETRYKPIVKNLDGHRAELGFRPILDYLKMYSRGILVDQLRHADEVLPLNGLTKSGVNVLLVAPTFVHNIFTNDANDAPLMMGDAMAMNHAKNSHSSQLDVVTRFEDGIKEAINYGEKWALEGDFKQALEQLTKTRKIKAMVKERVKENGVEITREVEKEIEVKAAISSGDRAVIANQLVGARFYDNLTTLDDSDRFRQLIDFSEGERPGFLGFGSGNSPRRDGFFMGGWLPWNWSEADSNVNFWNYTGSVNNLYAARGILSYVTTKSEVWRPFVGEPTTEMFANYEIKKGEDGKLYRLDRAATEAYQLEAANKRNSITGSGGSFALEIECHIPGMGIECQKWGDEAKIGIPGRMLEMGITAYVGYRGIKQFGNAWTLGRVKGAGEPFRVWWKQGRWYRPYPATAMSEAREAAVKLEQEAIKNGTKIVKPKWLGNRAWEGFKSVLYNNTLGKMKGVSEGRKAAIAAAAAKAPSKGAMILTDAMLVIGIVHATDKRTKAYSNPYDLDYELDMSKPQDPTKPDPILSAQPPKK